MCLNEANPKLRLKTEWAHFYRKHSCRMGLEHRVCLRGESLWRMTSEIINQQASPWLQKLSKTTRAIYFMMEFTKDRILTPLSRNADKIQWEIASFLNTPQSTQQSLLQINIPCGNSCNYRRLCTLYFSTTTQDKYTLFQNKNVRYLLTKLDAVSQKMNIAVIFGCQAKVASSTHLSLLLKQTGNACSWQEAKGVKAVMDL